MFCAELFFSARGWCSCSSAAGAPGGFEATGSLATARYYHTATLLPNGMVLVAGGLDNNFNALASAELYDPATGTWTATGSLATARSRHTATLLLNGMVLVAGGLDNNFTALASAELYDPATGTWTATGSLATARFFHTATLLPNGMVLVAGGVGNNSILLASAELYDPATGTWTATGSLATARFFHRATLLPNGMVLVAGGAGNNFNALASAELYVASPPLITSPLVAIGTIGVPFSYQFEATGATSLAVSDLPAGLSFDPDLRAILGSPTAEGTFQIGLSATNPFGTTSANLVLTIQSYPTTGPVINSITCATGRTGSPFNFQVSTTGGSLLTRLSATGLPDGLTVDDVTGVISGSATTDGSFSVTLSPTDAGFTNEATLQLTFTSDLAVPVIVSPENAFLYSGVSFGYTFLAPTSDASDPVTYSVIGQLPAGLGLNQETGVISGTPQIVLGLQPMRTSPAGLSRTCRALPAIRAVAVCKVFFS